jgi:putative endonuclease
MERQRIGQNAEDAAVGFLESQSLTVLLRNFRRRLGELDIVACDGDVLAIVEVRTRSSEKFGGAAASVNLRKQAKIRRTAALLLQQRRDFAAMRVRFDVVVVKKTGPTWIRNAFT